MIVCTFKALKHERVSLKTTLRSYFTLRRAELILNWSWTDPGTVWVCLVDLISSELMNLTDFSLIVCSDVQCFSCGSRWLCCFCCGASEPFLRAETSWSPVSRVLNPPQSLWLWEETSRTKFWPMKLFLDENSHTVSQDDVWNSFQSD